jgi:hypothetical protein
LARMCTSPSMIYSSNHTLSFGGQGPYCWPWHQEASQECGRLSTKLPATELGDVKWEALHRMLKFSQIYEPFYQAHLGHCQFERQHPSVPKWQLMIVVVNSIIVLVKGQIPGYSLTFHPPSGP